jgi:Spy/CpxP family protein refolding chaperone
MNRRTFALTTLFSALLGTAGGTEAQAQDAFGGLRRRLRLSDEQQEKIQQLYRDSDRRKREIDELLKKLYRDLDKLYDRYDFDRGKVKNVSDQISDVRRRSLTLYRENEEKLRSILTREQFERLRNITQVKKGERESKDDDE